MIFLHFTSRLIFALALLPSLVLQDTAHCPKPADIPVKVYVPLAIPPDAPQAKYIVTQGNFNTYSHIGSEQYAWDFVLNTPGSFPVAAAFNGTIEGFSTGNAIRCKGVNKEYVAPGAAPALSNPTQCWSYANYILLKSDDLFQYRSGSGALAAPQPVYALYLHLAKDSLAQNPAHPGQTWKLHDHVLRGQTLAMSGDTGWTCDDSGCGVHLHFQLEIAPRADIAHIDGPCVDHPVCYWYTNSIPALFLNSELNTAPPGDPQNGCPVEKIAYPLSAAPIPTPTPTPVPPNPVPPPGGGGSGGGCASTSAMLLSGVLALVVIVRRRTPRIAP